MDVNKFDKQIREYLDKQELPFDSKAWEQMSTRLDKVMPVNKPGLPWKTILGISTAIITASVVYISLGNSSVQSPSNTTNSLASLTQTSAQETSMSQERSDKGKSTQEVHIDLVQNIVNDYKLINKENHQSNSEISQHNRSKTVAQKGLVSSVTVIPLLIKDINGFVEAPLSIISQNNTIKYSFDLLSTYCENQTLELENKYGSTFQLISENQSSEIPVKGTLVIKKLQAGEYTVYNGSQKIQSFSVLPIERSSKISVIENYHFVKGVPQITIEPVTQNFIQSWSLNGVSMSGEDYTINPFYKGDYDIVFNTVGTNGCPMEISNKIVVDQNYNLLAPNAFNINSQDQRNRTFIPYALTQRDTPFEMLILEPSTGRVIHKSTTAEGWDGIDQTTGELVPVNKTYIWKVTLFKPLPGEKKEYSNVITRVQ